MSDVQTRPASQRDVRLTLPVPIAHEGARILQKHVSTNPLSRLVADSLDIVTNVGAWDADFQNAKHTKKLDEVARQLIDLQRDGARLEKCTLEVSEVWREEASGGAPIDNDDGSVNEIAVTDPGVSHALRQKIDIDKDGYDEQTPLQKYGTDPKYKTYREVVWDVLHPDEDCPPIATLLREMTADDEEDLDDMQMTYGATRSLKCPLTMVTFREPVRSAGCPHTFEKDAILQLIRSMGVSERGYLMSVGQWPQRGGANRRGGRRNPGETLIPDSQDVASQVDDSSLDVVKCPCPIAGCSNRIGAADLAPDPKMLRRLMVAGRDIESEHASGDSQRPPATAIYSSDGELPEEEEEEESDDNDTARVKRPRRSEVDDVMFLE